MSIFNKRITMLGKAGIIYDDNGIKYFIDSEGLTGKPDLAIFQNSIRYDNPSLQENVLSSDEKKQIALKVMNELESMGMTVEICEGLD